MLKRVLAVGLACAACASSFAGTTEKYKKTVYMLHKDISAVMDSAEDDALEIIITKSRVYNSAAVVFGLAGAAVETLGVMKTKGLMPKTERIRFTSAVPMKDKYGNVKPQRVLAVTFMTSELAKGNYATKNGLLPGELLNLYEKIWRLTADADLFINDYCREGVGKISRDFCRKEAW